MMRLRLSSAGVAALASAAALHATPASAQFGPPPELPDGDGKEMVETVCTACHTTFNIVGGSGYTEAGWAALSETMVDLSETPEIKSEIVSYLAEHFPPNVERHASLIDGPLEVEFTSWEVPTLGQRARDQVDRVLADGTGSAEYADGLHLNRLQQKQTADEYRRGSEQRIDPVQNTPMTGQ